MARNLVRSTNERPQSPFGVQAALPAARSIARGVDLAGALAEVEHREQPAEGDVLTDHHAEFHDLRGAELLAKLGLKELSTER